MTALGSQNENGPFSYHLRQVVDEQVEDQLERIVKSSILDFLNHRQEQLAYTALFGVNPVHNRKASCTG